jgi:site-specific DNA-methyltransferase (adenine-specific)
MTNTVLNQDCLEGMKELPDESIDLILTDPPYELIELRPYFEQFNRLLKSTGSIYVFGDKNIVAEHWFHQFEMWKKELLIWHYKNSPKPRGRWRMSMQAIIYGYKSAEATWNEDEARTEYLPSTLKLQGRIRPSCGRYNKEALPYDVSKGALARDVIECPALTGHLSRERVGHPDQKPLSLFEKLIKTSSNEGDVVLDSFGGSGTTAFACLNTKRKYIIFEKEQTWFDKIVQELKR